MTIDKQRQHKRLKKKSEGQTEQDVGLDMEGKGDTQLCGFYS